MPYFYDHLVRTFSNFHHFYQFLKGIYYVSVIFIGFLINSAVFRGESLHDLNSLKFTETFFKANHLKNLKKKIFQVHSKWLYTLVIWCHVNYIKFVSRIVQISYLLVLSVTKKRYIKTCGYYLYISPVYLFWSYVTIGV